MTNSQLQELQSVGQVKKVKVPDSSSTMQYIQGDKAANNVETEEAEFFENYEDLLSIYNSDYDNKELVEDPDEVQS